MAFCLDTIKKMLPKTYHRRHVADEIYVALIHFNSLTPCMDQYVYNDGTTKVLVKLTGTIPAIFKDVIYNIPICLWLEESYPRTAPICYVKPTKEMMILRGKYISNNGEVLLPYLEEWKQGQCDLVSLLQVMTAMFGDVPPVCVKYHPETEPNYCRLQVQRREEVLSNPDGSRYLSLPRDDGQPFHSETETNC